MKQIINFSAISSFILFTFLVNGQNVTVLPDGKFGIQNNSPVEQFQIGDKWTFHNGGAKFIGYNVFWDGTSDKRLFAGSASQIRFEENQLRFMVAPSGAIGSNFNPTNYMTISANGNTTFSKEVILTGGGSSLYLASNAATIIGSSTNRIFFVYNSYNWNDLYARNFYSISDRKLKTNVKPIPNALEKVIKLKGVSFIYKMKDETELSYGFISQEVEKIIPEIVSETKDNTKALNYDAIIPFLVESIKEQNEKIIKLKERIILLEKKNNSNEKK